MTLKYQYDEYSASKIKVTNQTYKTEDDIADLFTPAKYLSYLQICFLVKLSVSLILRQKNMINESLLLPTVV